MTNNPIIQVHSALPDAFGGTAVLPLRGTPNPDGLSAALQVQVIAAGAVSGGFAGATAYATNSDAVDVLNSETALAAASFLYGFNDVAGQFQRVRVQGDSADALATGIGHLATIGHGVLFNGASWDRARSLDATNLSAFSGIGGQIAAGPGEWSVEHRPAVSTQATITRAAGAAGVRHVCRSITASLVAVAAQTIVDVLLRDGASGAGTVLWSARLQVPAGDSKQITLTGLNIVGSAAAAMTLEFGAAPVATNFEGVAMTGYDAS